MSLLTLLNAPAGGGGGGGAVANYANAGGSGVTSVDTSATPFTSTTGSTFVICVSYNSNPGAPTSVTDNKGNTYALKLGQTTAVNARFYICENGTGGAGHYATVSLPFTDYPSLHFMELTGVPAGSFDQVVGAADFSSPYTATTGTLAQADELILSYISADGSGGTDIYAETSGFTLLGQVNDSSQFWPSAVAYKVVSATTAVPTSWTVTPSVGNTAVIVAGFKVTAGGGGITCTLAVTDTADTLASTATVDVVAALTSTDAADTLSSSATLAIVANLTQTDAADTAASTATVEVVANLAATDADDTLASTAIVGSGITCTLAVTDAADTLASTATVAVGAALSTTDTADTLASTATVAVSAALSATDAADTLSATATLPVVVNLAVTDEADTLSSSTITGSLPEIIATLAVTDDPDTLQSTLAHEEDRRGHGVRNAGPMDFRLYDDVFTFPIKAKLAVTDEDDRLVSRARVSWVVRVVSANLFDADDTVKASAVVVPWEPLSLSRSEMPLMRVETWRPKGRQPA